MRPTSYSRYLGSLLVLCCLATPTLGQSIVIDSVTHFNSCDSVSFDVCYTANGSFATDNLFILNFFPYPLAPDTVRSSVSGKIHYKVPYTYDSIRIVSTSPKVSSAAFPLPKYVRSDNFYIRHDKYWIIQGEPVLIWVPSLLSLDTTLFRLVWDFDTGASPRQFEGYQPPLVTYSIPGRKTIRQTVTMIQGCSSVRVDTELYVQSTSPSLGYAPSIVYSSGKVRRYGPFTHILTGATLDTNKAFDAIFVDSGGTARISWPAGGTIYVKSGGKVLYTGSNGSVQNLVLEDGAILTGDTLRVLMRVHRCKKLDFDSSEVVKPVVIGSLCALGSAVI